MQEIDNAERLNSMPLSKKHHGVPAVYKITNNTNGKVYVGATANYFRRASGHISASKAKITKSYIASALKEHGVNGFTFSVVESLPHNKDILREREKHWINKLKSCDPDFGYNTSLSKGRAPGAKNAKHSDWAPIGTRISPGSMEHLVEMKKRGFQIAKLVNKAILDYKAEHEAARIYDCQGS